MNWVVSSKGEVASSTEEISQEASSPKLSDFEGKELRGIVKFFDRSKGFGYIKPAPSAQLKEDIHFWATTLPLERRYNLMSDEPIDVTVTIGERGPTATSVKPLEVRKKGTVKNWVDDRGFGFIETDDSTETVKVAYRDILMDGFAKLEPEERVEFGLNLASPSTGQRLAKRVKRLDASGALERFANIDKFKNNGELIIKLEDHALDETWTYQKFANHLDFPILYSYITYTFSRIEEENKIVHGEDENGKPFSCFNTGLVTGSQKEIFAYFTKNKKGDQEWCLEDFLQENDPKLSAVSPLPLSAHYFEDPKELLYDVRVELRPQLEHIYKRNDRFPKSFQESNYKDNILQTAIEKAIKRVKRNYKTAIPQYHNGKLQLLLPLCIEKDELVDLALVVERRDKVYLGWTVLPLDWAYRNARLIARPDREWLEP